MTHWLLGEQQDRDFAGGPVAGTSSCNRGGCRFYPWSGSKAPSCLTAKEPQHRAEAVLKQIQLKTLKKVHVKKTFTKAKRTARQKSCCVTTKAGSEEIVQLPPTILEDLLSDCSQYTFSWNPATMLWGSPCQTERPCLGVLVNSPSFSLSIRHARKESNMEASQLPAPAVQPPDVQVTPSQSSLPSWVLSHHRTGKSPLLCLVQISGPQNHEQMRVTDSHHQVQVVWASNSTQNATDKPTWLGGMLESTY